MHTMWFTNHPTEVRRSMCRRKKWFFIMKSHEPLTGNNVCRKFSQISPTQSLCHVMATICYRAIILLLLTVCDFIL